MKGAFEEVASRCTTVATSDGGLVALDAGGVASLTDAATELAEQGLRVLACADRVDPELGRPRLRHSVDVSGLRLIGLVGMVDPPRAEARAAVASCHSAGVDVKMITGDNVVTATAIAREVGIEGEALSGADLDRLDDDELAARIGSIGVFARSSPEHKLRIIGALKAHRQVVAMTGDGVNDAPALRAADIGVAMGQTGTEVAKEAADVVLATDDFSTIVGRRPGRARDLRQHRQVRALPAGHEHRCAAHDHDRRSAEHADPVQPDPTALDQPDHGRSARPRPERRPGRRGGDGSPATQAGRADPSESAAGPRGRGRWGDGRRRPRAARVRPGASGGPRSRSTCGFTAFVLFQVANALGVRDEYRSLFSRRTLTNSALWGALGLVIVLQVLVVELPFAQRLFDTTSLSSVQWGVVVLTALGFLLVQQLLVVLLGRSAERHRSRCIQLVCKAKYLSPYWDDVPAKRRAPRRRRRVVVAQAGATHRPNLPSAGCSSRCGPGTSGCSSRAS